MPADIENVCPNCGNELQAVQHLENSNSSQNETFQYDCVLCGYKYMCESGLEKADTIYDKKSTYCRNCDMHFSTISTMKRHLLVHSEERPYRCEVSECRKAFKTKAALKRHRVVHTGECPFECSTCRRKFNQICNLRKHLLIHSNNCPYYCNSCGKGFNQLSNLKKHMSVHEASPVKKITRNKKPEHSVIPLGLDREVTRPFLTFIKPSEVLS